MCRMYANIWIEGKQRHDAHEDQDAPVLQLQLQQRKQVMRNGICSAFQKLDLVHHHWLVDEDPNVWPDGKFYASKITYVMFRRPVQQYVYQIHSLDMKWKTSNILEGDHALYLEGQLPSNAIIGID